MDASKADPSDFRTRIDALDWNRRLWTALAADCSDPQNQLPPQLRASFISLSLFVNRHTSAVMRREESFDDLIEINRMIMQGLAASAEAA
jgi:flagellar protein FlaF